MNRYGRSVGRWDKKDLGSHGEVFGKATEKPEKNGITYEIMLCESKVGETDKCLGQDGDVKT